MEYAIEETERCVSTYGPYGNFILIPFLFNERGNGLMVGDDRVPAIAETLERIGKLG